MADINFKDLKAELLANPEVRQIYEGPASQFSAVVTRARLNCGLTQAQLAERMNTSQSYIAKLENGAVSPTLKTLQKVAKATGTRAKFELEPA